MEEFSDLLVRANSDRTVIRLNMAAWPSRVRFSGDAIKTFDSRRATINGRIIDIRLDNGRAVYQVTGYDRAADWYETILVYSEGPE